MSGLPRSRCLFQRRGLPFIIRCQLLQLWHHFFGYTSTGETDWFVYSRAFDDSRAYDVWAYYAKYQPQ